MWVRWRRRCFTKTVLFCENRCWSSEEGNALERRWHEDIKRRRSRDDIIFRVIIEFPHKNTTIIRLVQSATVLSLTPITFDGISYVASLFRGGHFIKVKYSLFFKRGHHQSTGSGNFRQRQKLKTDLYICHVRRYCCNQYSSYYQRFHALIQRECFFLLISVIPSSSNMLSTLGNMSFHGSFSCAIFIQLTTTSKFQYWCILWK